MATRAALVGRVIAVSAGGASTLRYAGRTVETAFVKSEVAGKVHVSRLGIAGDEQVFERHGGPDMALLAYPGEHYDFWRREGLDLPAAAAMGENLTVTGLVETDVWLGDVYAVGSVVVQVTRPRSPCYKIAARYGRKDLPVLAQETGYVGYLLRVLTEGEVGAGDSMELIDRQDHGVTVDEAGRVLNVDRNDIDGARRVLGVGALAPKVRHKLEQRVAAAEPLGLDTSRLFLTDE